MVDEDIDIIEVIDPYKELQTLSYTSALVQISDVAFTETINKAKMFKTAPKPASLLGYHRVLSPTAGVRVSPLCLGAMNFGENWKAAMGECTKETAFGMLDFFWEQGGNFIDTANNCKCRLRSYTRSITDDHPST